MKNLEKCFTCGKEEPIAPYYCRECIEKAMEKADKELKGRKKIV